MGDQSIISQLLRQEKEDVADYQIVNVTGETTAAQQAVKLIRTGAGDAILKGHLQTSTLLRAVLDRERDIRKANFLSHVTLLEIPDYPKLLGFTDGAMNLFPNFDQKKELIQTAVSLFQALGYEQPKVGIIEANELVNPKIESSIEAEKLMLLNEEAPFCTGILQGPISFDLATDPQAVAAKHYQGKVAGDADILVGANLTVTNVMVKALQTFGQAKTAGVILGAHCPIILVSRASLAEEKLNAILLALASEKEEESCQ